MAPVSNEQKRFLKQLSDQLTISDVGSMKFVCRDEVGAGLLERIDNEKAYQLFSVLEQKGLVTDEDMSYLRDIFIKIQRSDLAAKIQNYESRVQDTVDYASYAVPPSPGISAYRTLLKTIADELTSSQVDEIKFLLNIPRGKSNSIKDGESLLLYMENSHGLCETNFTTLLECLDDVHRKDLIKKVNNFCSNEAQTFNVPTHPSSPDPKASDLMAPGNGSKTTDEAPPHYKMKEPPFGYALIINNEKFEGQTAEGLVLNERCGTKIDLDNLKDLWKQLGFVVSPHSNLKAHQIMTVVQDMVKTIEEDKVKPSCFVCCIMSHGREGDIYGTDSKAVHLNDVTGFFKEALCIGLAGKPKLFFIQACRGQNKLKSTLRTSQQESSTESDALPAEAEDEVFRRNANVNEYHFLLGFSTLPGYVSWRSREYGSWYVSSLVKVFSKYYLQEDVTTMMVRVNEEVSEAYTKEQYKQCPAPVLTLTKRVYFIPDES